MDMPFLGRTLITFGLVIALIGLCFAFAGRIPFLGKLPGDIVYHRGNFTVFAPIVTSILLSLILTVLFNLFAWRR